MRMSLLQMSIAGAVMIFAIIVIRFLMINRVPKKTFSILWDVVLMRLFIPFSLPSGMSIYSLVSRKTAPVVTNVPTVVFPGASFEQTVTAPVQPETVSLTGVSVWGIVWGMGMVFCAVVFTVAYWKCYQEFQMSLPVENDMCRRWLQTHRLRRAVSIRQSDRISSPLTFGVLHPVILMPKKTDWEKEADLQYVLEHEFVHIQRFDTVYKLLLIAAVCVHWFNPVVWVMYVLANRDIELSCDETVIHRFGSNARASYANVLICMEETKSGFAPLCSHFSKNAIEERITAIMKTKKTTILSLVAAAVLVTGTVTVFATSAQEKADSSHEASTSDAVETDGEQEFSKTDEEYLAAGLKYKKNMWYYQGKAVASLYDDNGGIYTNGNAANGSYLNIKRDSKGSITKVAVITKKQFLELVDKHRNVTESDDAEETLMSYNDPNDGRTYYSFDDGKTFEPMTDEEFEARFPTQDVEWWTYDEYKAWLDNEKTVLQSMLGEKAWTGGEGEFVWTQKKIDETIAVYEEILKDIKNGMMYSKSVDGQEEVMLSYNPVDRAMGTSDPKKEICIKLSNGEEKTFGPYETNEEMLAVVKPFCEKQVRSGNMTKKEAEQIISKYTEG